MSAEPKQYVESNPYDAGIEREKLAYDIRKVIKSPEFTCYSVDVYDKFMGRIERLALESDLSPGYVVACLLDDARDL